MHAASSSAPDVIVVGAGIVGASTAYQLARRGVRVTVLEKDEAAGGQSGRNWGFVRRQGCDPIEIELVAHAGECWTRLSEDIGPTLTLVRRGLLNTATTAAGMDKYRNWLAATSASDRFGSRLVSSDEISELLPVLGGSWVGGLFTPTDGHADPVAATRAIMNAAIEAGASIETGVTALSLSTDGAKVTGVVTTEGPRPAGNVVVAAGAWASQLLGTAGVVMPIRWVRATAGRTVPLDTRITDLAVATPMVGFSQRSDGSLVFGTAAWSDFDLSIQALRNIRLFLPNYLRNWRMFRFHLNGYMVEDLLRQLPGSRLRRNVYAWPRIREPQPNFGKIRGAHADLVRLVQGIGRPAMAGAWAGIVDVTPDALPVLGRPERTRGLVIASGLSSHGFGIGPGVGSVTASVVMDETSPIDLAPFRIERFDDGRVRAHDHL